MMSKKQWIGLLIVVLMVAAVELTAYLTKQWRERQTVAELLEFQPEREKEFEQYIDSLHEAEYAARRAEYAKRYPKPVIHPQPFDPNTADSSLLVTVGLKPWMAHNLIRYREAGKVFRQPDDLRGLYGMTDSLYATLKPYIQIDSVKTDSFSIRYRAVIEPLSGLKKDTILNLNTTDTAELQFLRGVGSYTAVQIIRYRESLGGYYSVNQLYEIKGLPTERVDSLLTHLYADTTLIVPIDVNRATVRQLQRHPYISYPQAEQLYDLRRRKIRLSSLDELSAIFTADERRRLAPYLRFSVR